MGADDAPINQFRVQRPITYRAIILYCVYVCMYVCMYVVCASSATAPLCSPPSLPKYELADSRPFYTAGTVVALSCAKGYQLAGSDIVKCQVNGTWFPRLPDCEVVRATTDPLKGNNATLLPRAGPVGRLQGKYYSGCILYQCE